MKTFPVTLVTKQLLELVIILSVLDVWCDKMGT